MNLDALEEEITTLAVQLSAATYRLLDCIRRFDEADGWATPGFISCAHWLSWRIGLGLNAAREKLRVAHALVQLPQLAAAFQRGEISYSKVRALTRIARPEIEETLLTIAEYGTASHVEKLVRKYRHCEKLVAEKEQSHHERRALSAYWDDDGMLVVQARLPPQAGAAFMKALEACEDSESSRHADERRADALSRLCEQALGGESRDAYQVVVHVDAPVLAAPSTPGRCELEDGPGVTAETSRRLTCDGSTITMQHDQAGNVLDVGRKTRVITTALRRALRERDKCCRFPGCTNTRFVDGHHIQHWAEGGETKLDNLALLCGRHHRLLHEGGYGMRRCDDRLVFTDPRGREIPDSPKPPVPQVLTLPPAAHAMRTWNGDAMDYGFVLEGLMP